MSFMDIFTKILDLIIGRGTPKPVEKPLPNPDYQIPATVLNFMSLCVPAHKLTEAELDDLKSQIIEMGKRNIQSYIIHTHGRKTNPYDGWSGDRYWEMGYVRPAGCVTYVMDTTGRQYEEIVKSGKADLIYETVLEKWNAP